MRGCFEVCLLIIFHFFFFFLCVCFIAGVSPAAASIGPRAGGPPSSRAPRGPANVGGIRVKPIFLGFNVSSIRARLTVHRIPRHFVVKRPAARPKRCPWLGNRPSPTAAPVGPRARDPPSSRSPRGPCAPVRPSLPTQVVRPG